MAQFLPPHFLLGRRVLDSTCTLRCAMALATPHNFSDTRRRLLPIITSDDGRPITTRAGAPSLYTGPELVVPLQDCIDSRIVFAAAPSMGHHQEGHPESHYRVPAILKGLEEAKLTPQFRGREILRLPSFSPASLASVSAVHSAAYLSGLQKVSPPPVTPPECGCAAPLFPPLIRVRGVVRGVQAMQRAAEEGLVHVEASGPTYATASTYAECMLATGAGLAVLDCVVAASRAASGFPPPGFALVRPPGHHAVPLGPMGFCLLDHIAVAARYAQREHGLQRVMIVDVDVHHGNGTHDCFYHDPDVFFLSTHQVGGYPGTGKMEEVGAGPGEGSTLNLPLPGGAGDETMSVVMDDVIAPAVLRFKPDIILVSAGYDAHYLDPLAGLQFTTGTFYRVAAQLHELAKQVCGGRLVFFLEGGYDLKSLSNSVADTFRAVLGDESSSKKVDNPAMLYDEPSVVVRDAIAQIRAIHSLT